MKRNHLYHMVPQSPWFFILIIMAFLFIGVMYYKICYISIIIMLLFTLVNFYISQKGFKENYDQKIYIIIYNYLLNWIILIILSFWFSILFLAVNLNFNLLIIILLKLQIFAIALSYSLLLFFILLIDVKRNIILITPIMSRFYKKSFIIGDQLWIIKYSDYFFFVNIILGIYSLLVRFLYLIDIAVNPIVFDIIHNFIICWIIFFLFNGLNFLCYMYKTRLIAKSVKEWKKWGGIN